MKKSTSFSPAAVEYEAITATYIHCSPLSIMELEWRDNGRPGQLNASVQLRGEHRTEKVANFTFHHDLWYVVLMNRNYVGIVTYRGLEALFPETEYAVRYVDRRIYGRQPFLGFCCWAVLPEEVAQQVHLHLQQGERETALRTLEFLATEYGPIMPSDHRRGRPCH